MGEQLEDGSLGLPCAPYLETGAPALPGSLLLCAESAHGEITSPGSDAITLGTLLETL